MLYIYNYLIFDTKVFDKAEKICYHYNVSSKRGFICLATPATVNRDRNLQILHRFTQTTFIRAKE